MHSYNLRSLVLTNGIGMLLFKVILAVHQTFFFTYASYEVYGITTACFAALFFSIAITDFGIDYSIQAQYRQTTSQTQFIATYITHKAWAILGGLLVVFLLVSYSSWYTVVAKQPTLLLICLVLSFCVEQIKKTTHTLAQMLNQTKTIVKTELCSLSLYLILFWAHFYYTGTITVYSACVPLVITSIIETAYLISHLYTLTYKNLRSSTQIDQDADFAKGDLQIIHNHFMHYMLQCLKAVYSPNMLILVLAYYSSMSTTGIMKIYVTLLGLIYAIVQRAIGSSTAFHFSQLTSMSERIMSFKVIRIHYYLLILLLYFTAISSYLIISHLIAQAPHVYVVVSFTAIMSLQYLCILYEQLYVSLHKAYFLVYVSGSYSTLAALSIYFIGIHPLNALIFSLSATIITCEYELKNKSNIVK